MASTIVFLAIIGFLLCAFGLVVVFSAYRSRQRKAAISQWPTITGRVFSAKVTESKIRNPSGSGSRRISVFHPSIRYSYVVNGQSYEGSRYVHGGTNYNHAQAAAIVERYPEGKEVAVYYDPQNPSEAVLEAAATGGTALIVVGGILLVLGLLLPLVGVIIILVGL